MGFERATAIMQGTKNFTDFSGIISNYETDIFRPIFDELEKLSDKKYTSTLPQRIGSAGILPARTGFQPAQTSRQDAAKSGLEARSCKLCPHLAQNADSSVACASQYQQTRIVRAF